MIYVLIFSILFGFFLSKNLRSNIKYNSDYIKLGDNCWITPNGFVDLTPRLTLWQEHHNKIMDFEIEQEKIQEESDDAFSEFETQNIQYKLMKDDIDKMLPSEKLKFIPLWCSHIAEERIKNNINKGILYIDWGHMPFDVFIASEIIPNKWYGRKFNLRFTKPRIRYIV